MAEGVYRITEQFEDAVAHYTGAPFCVAVDNCSNALFLALEYEGIEGKEITIPSRTYPSVPCEIIHAGGKVRFKPTEGDTLKGAYPLEGSRTWDSALRFTAGMYIPNTFMCLSFTGPYKHLKLSKGGAILTDDYNIPLVRILVQETVGGLYGLDGFDEEKMVPVFQREDDFSYDLPVPAETHTIEVVPNTSWSSRGRIAMRQKDPLPMTINAIRPEVVLGSR